MISFIYFVTAVVFPLQRSLSESDEGFNSVILQEKAQDNISRPAAAEKE